jgi:hypothetical protein
VIGATTGLRPPDLRHLARQLSFVGLWNESRTVAHPKGFARRSSIQFRREAAAAQRRLEAGSQFGKIVLVD